MSFPLAGVALLLHLLNHVHRAKPISFASVGCAELVPVGQPDQDGTIEVLSGDLVADVTPGQSYCLDTREDRFYIWTGKSFAPLPPSDEGNRARKPG